MILMAMLLAALASCGVQSSGVYEAYGLAEAVGDCPDPSESTFDWAVRDDGCLEMVPVPHVAWMLADGTCFIPTGCDGEVPCCTFYRPGGSAAPPFVCTEGAECNGAPQATWLFGCPDPQLGELVMVSFRSL